jgi:hypothetical protein
MITLIVISVLLALLARRILKKSRVLDLQSRPYRYQVDSRRSPWSNRLGF